MCQYMTRQGGPQTFPAAWWQVSEARRLLQRNAEAVSRLLREQPVCHDYVILTMCQNAEIAVTSSCCAMHCDA